MGLRYVSGLQKPVQFGLIKARALTNIVWTPTTLSLQQGSSTNVQLVATAFPATALHYTVHGTLPAGLSLSISGLLTGIPTGSGAYSFSVYATNPKTGDFAPFQFTGTIAADAVVNLSNGQVTLVQNVPFSYQPSFVSTSSSTLTYSAMNLPSGLTINNSTGLITGTTNQTGTYNFSVTASDGYAMNTENYTGTIDSVSFPSTTVSLAEGVTVNKQFSATSSLSTTVTFSSSVPAGLTLSSSGLLSGTPTGNGAYSFTVTATDVGGASASQTFAGNITADVVTFATPGNLNLVQNVAMTPYQVVASDTIGAPLTFSVANINQTFTNTNTTWTCPAGITSINISGSATTATTISQQSVGVGAISNSNFAAGTSSNPDPTNTHGNITWSQLYNLTVDNYNNYSAAIGQFGASVTQYDAQFTFRSTSPYAGNASQVTGSSFNPNTTQVISFPSTQEIVSLGSIYSYTQPNSLKTSGSTITYGNITTYEAVSTTGLVAVGWGFNVNVGTATIISFNGQYNFDVNGETYNNVPVTPGQTYTITAYNGTININMSGFLPAGLTMSSSGIITGTPTGAGSYSFVLSATDGYATGTSNTFSGIIDGISLPTTSFSFIQGQSVNYQFAATDTESNTIIYSISNGTLPSGLTLSNSGLLSGVPLNTGSYSFTVSATDGAATSTETFTGNVAPDTVTISSGGTISLTQGVAVSQQLFTATSLAGLVVSYYVSAGTLPSGLSLSGTGYISGTPTGSGAYNFTVTATDGLVYTPDNFTGTITPDVISFSSNPSSFSVTQTVAENYTVSASSSSGVTPITYSISAGSLPAGLTLNGSSGLISGTPTGYGAYSFTVGAADAYVSNTQSFNGTESTVITFTNLPSNLSITQGKAVSYNFTTTDSASLPVTYSSSNLPTGLTLSSAGSLTGAILSGSNYSFTVTATDGISNAMQSLSGSITADSISGLSNTGFSLAVGSAVSYQLTATSTASRTVTYSVTSGTLPTGVTLSGSGLFSGTPTGAGSYSFVVTATDGVASATQSFSGNTTSDIVTMNNYYSVQITGTSSYITSTVTNYPVYAANTAFTIEAFIYPTAINSTVQAIYSNYQGSGTDTTGIIFQVSNGKLVANSYNGWSGGGIASNSSVTVNTWNHVVFTRNASGVMNFYINGVKDSATITYAAAMTNSGLWIGNLDATYGGWFEGYISNLRITNTQVYTGSSFTVPTSPLTAVSGTQLLTCQGSTIVDDSLNEVPLSGNSVTVSSQNPFGIGTLSLSQGSSVSYQNKAQSSFGYSISTYAISAGTLPTGLTLNGSTGLITGAPTGSGSYSFTITATDSNSTTGSIAFSGTIAADTVTVSPSSISLAQGVTLSGVTITGTSSLGNTITSYAVSAGTLPSGLTLNGSTGALTGTPTGSGSYSFTVTATDSHSITGSQVYSGTITADTITNFSTISSISLNQGQTYT